jgi:hypothetical protein
VERVEFGKTKKVVIMSVFETAEAHLVSMPAVYKRLSEYGHRYFICIINSVFVRFNFGVSRDIFSFFPRGNMARSTFVRLLLFIFLWDPWCVVHSSFAGPKDPWAADDAEIAARRESESPTIGEPGINPSVIRAILQGYTPVVYGQKGTGVAFKDILPTLCQPKNLEALLWWEEQAPNHHGLKRTLEQLRASPEGRKAIEEFDRLKRSGRFVPTAPFRGIEPETLTLVQAIVHGYIDVVQASRLPLKPLLPMLTEPKNLATALELLNEEPGHASFENGLAHLMRTPEGRYAMYQLMKDGKVHYTPAINSVLKDLARSLSKLKDGSARLAPLINSPLDNSAKFILIKAFGENKESPADVAPELTDALRNLERLSRDDATRIALENLLLKQLSSVEALKRLETKFGQINEGSINGSSEYRAFIEEQLAGHSTPERVAALARSACTAGDGPGYAIFLAHLQGDALLSELTEGIKAPSSESRLAASRASIELLKRQDADINRDPRLRGLIEPARSELIEDYQRTQPGAQGPPHRRLEQSALWNILGLDQKWNDPKNTQAMQFWNTNPSLARAMGLSRYTGAAATTKLRLTCEAALSLVPGFSDVKKNR